MEQLDRGCLGVLSLPLKLLLVGTGPRNWACLQGSLCPGGSVRDSLILIPVHFIRSEAQGQFCLAEVKASEAALPTPGPREAQEGWEQEGTVGLPCWL